ncbi:Rho GTPase-activating protein 30 [Triplophysa tibetana]|uniref:Rho GTPase-activating protein 30 n=1 Tax=Triplophysa tibetana TaxID=1572043 RepID=A0A5A9PF30_9TELE|nr:Rho GTPase-activating protein 30 [Triplophysa tibetana]
MRRGRRKVANRDKVFGCDLQEHLISTAQEIPSVLRNCSEFIEEYGIVDGIYRLSGVSSNTQKLRNEFDTEGTPDLYKDVYLQDIHCVSSLCKAYFRELPNPLLTYELYDRFALEDERLVKIKEVLKDLPAPHYRTLEFLMHHLVKMSSFASQTNMHSRNLAIVWAPNLLRSKDIESTGFNGTAAFMEVRVQSIVVEFILTHVPEVFADSGSAMGRRKSLPSPALLANPDDHFFKSLPLHCSGNLSPGDGPPLMRPRKGSLKGRKWKSIFNLGGRLQDPRKKNKYCPKDKEKTSLRPAKSMDSLSSGPFAQDDSKHPPALLLSTPNPEGVASVGGGVSSGYAVTYRRTGGAQVSMVSGGTQGTYNRLESLGGAEGSSQGNSRSPGMTSKADRRAGIHISGPFSVTVPLHITSGLALGVLQGGWNEKEQTVQGDAADEEQAETKDEGEQVKGSEPETEPEQTYTDESKTDDDDDDDNAKESKGDPDSQPDLGEMTAQIIEEEDEGTVKSDMIQNQETIERSVEDVSPQNDEEEYMDMRGHLHPDPGISADGSEMDEFSEQDVQDAFGFLDMMDSCASNLFEFSVEAPEEVVEEDVDESTNTETPVSPVQNSSDECETLAVNMSTHRTLAGKSHSLPYKSRPFMPALSLSSDDDDYSPEDDEDDEDKDSEYEDMFCQSLPSAHAFHRLSWSAPETSTHCADDALSDSQSKCLDDVILPPNSEEPQSLSQWEDTILTAARDDVKTPAGTSVQIFNEEQVSADSKIENLHVDDDEVKSDDVTNDTNTMTVEGDPESSDGDEDTYFGADPIPCSLDPNGTETASINVHEPIQEQCTHVDPPPYTEIDTAVEIIITDVTESTDAQDKVNVNPSPDEENTTVRERTISDSVEMTTQPDGKEKSEESPQDEVKVFELETPEPQKILRGNEEEPEKELETEECLKDEEMKTQAAETEKSIESTEDRVKVFELETPEPQKILSGNEEEPEKELETEECLKDEEMKTQAAETEKSIESTEDRVKVFELETPEPQKILSGNEEDPEKELEMEQCVKDEEMATQSEETEKSEESLEDVDKAFDLETPKHEKILSGNEEDPEKDLEMEQCVKDEEMATQSVEKEKSKESPEEDVKVFEFETPEREKILSGNEEEPEKELETVECVKDVNKITEEEEEREEVKEYEPCEPSENTEQERVEMENRFDIHKEYIERNVEGREKDTDDDDERLGIISSEENLCEDDSGAQTEEPVNKKSSNTSDEQPPTAPEDRPVPEEERETSAPKHVKAVPTVPPKPQRSKLTALRKQFEDRDAERKQRNSQIMEADGPHNDETQDHQTDDTCHRDQENCREPTSETNGGGKPEHDEIKAPRDGSTSGDAGIDFRKDLQRDGEREAKRNSGVSMCFDEAVARATEKRSRETSERVSGAQWERECRREGFKHREKDDENKTD